MMAERGKVEVEEYDGGVDVLVCPRCGEGYLHHRAVTVYDRSEDDETTTVTAVHAGVSAIHREDSCTCENPSSRRDGIVIHFECECCEGALELTMAQHKGATLVGWRFESDELVKDRSA